MINTNTNNLHDFEVAAMQRMPSSINHNGKDMTKTRDYARHASRVPMAKYSNGVDFVWVSVVGKILQASQ